MLFDRGDLALAESAAPAPEADERFQRLHTEASARIEHDDQDFAAWDFKGFAICGKHLDTRHDLDEALEAFRIARSLTPPTPVLVDRLRLILTQLDQAGRRPGRLRPASHPAYLLPRYGDSKLDMLYRLQRRREDGCAGSEIWKRS